MSKLVIAGDLLDEWFVPVSVASCKGKDQTDFVERIAAANAEAIDAFGLETYFPESHPEIAIEHGHRYNYFCAPDHFSTQDVARSCLEQYCLRVVSLNELPQST